MKHLMLFIVALGLALTGCNQPPEVKLEDESDLEVSSISVPDSNLSLTSVDSSAVLPEDQVKFAGILQVLSVKYDAGQGVRALAYSRVLFEQRSRPVWDSGRIVGFHGIDLGPVLLNGSPMWKVRHRIPGKFSRRDTLAGFEYVADLSASFVPGGLYTWSATPDSVGPVSISIQAPEDLTVYSPKGGTVLSRDQDLPLHWRGQGNLAFIISSFEPLTKVATPVFVVRARVNRNHAVLSRKLLRLLPKRRFFVFTFVLMNRKETETVNHYPGRILVQATTVYNSYVELR